MVVNRACWLLEFKGSISFGYGVVWLYSREVSAFYVIQIWVFWTIFCFGIQIIHNCGLPFVFGVYQPRVVCRLLIPACKEIKRRVLVCSVELLPWKTINHFCLSKKSKKINFYLSLLLLVLSKEPLYLRLLPALPSTVKSLDLVLDISFL